MKPAPTSIAKRKSVPPAGPGRVRAQLFCIAAPAVFLVALVALSRSEPAPPVRATLVQNAPQQADSLLRPNRDELLAPELLAQAIAAVRSEKGEQQPALGDRELAAHLVRELSVGKWKSTSTGAWELSLEYRGGLAAGAAIVNRLAALGVEKYSVAAQAELREAAEEANRAAGSAREIVREAREQLVQVRQQVLQLERGQSDASTSVPAPVAQRDPTPNPQWTTLQTKLASLQSQREGLLRDFTEAHPAVVRLDAEVRELTAAVRNTPEYLDPPVLEVASAHDQVIGGGPKYSPPVDERAAAQRQIDQAELHAEQAEAAEAAALADAQATAAQLQAISQANLHVGERATLGAPVRQTRFGVVALALLLGLACGAGVAAWGVPEDGILRTQREAAASLGLPVVAVLPASDNAPGPRPVTTPGWARLVRLGCEATLAFFLFCVISSATRDAQFLGRLAANPFSAVVDGVCKIWATWVV